MIPSGPGSGLANYIHVLRDVEFLVIVLPNTFGFMFASVALSLLLGLLIALMLNRRFPGRWLVQSFVLLPLMVAPVIAAIMIRWMFNDQFGVVNAVLEGLGITPISWLTQRWTDVPRDPADRRMAVDALVRPDPARRPAKPAARAVRGGADRCGQSLGAPSDTSPCRCSGRSWWSAS